MKGLQTPTATIYKCLPGVKKYPTTKNFSFSSQEIISCFYALAAGPGSVPPLAFSLRVSATVTGLFHEVFFLPRGRQAGRQAGPG